MIKSGNASCQSKETPLVFIIATLSIQLKKSSWNVYALLQCYNYHLWSSWIETFEHFYSRGFGTTAGFQIYFLCLTHILWAKSHNILLSLFFFFPLHPFAFPLHFFLQGVVFIHQWKTLITPFWWGFRSDGAAVLCAA